MFQVGYTKRITDQATRAYHYAIMSYEEYRRLRDSIGSVLDDITTRLSGSPTAHKGREPKKKVMTNALA